MVFHTVPCCGLRTYCYLDSVVERKKEKKRRGGGGGKRVRGAEGEKWRSGEKGERGGGKNEGEGERAEPSKAKQSPKKTIQPTTSLTDHHHRHHHQSSLADEWTLLCVVS